jgi:hypothetical protein
MMTATKPEAAALGTTASKVKPSAKEPSSQGSAFHGPRESLAGIARWSRRRRQTKTAPISIVTAATPMSLSSHGE